MVESERAEINNKKQRARSHHLRVRPTTNDIFNTETRITATDSKISRDHESHISTYLLPLLSLFPPHPSPPPHPPPPPHHSTHRSHSTPPSSPKALPSSPQASQRKNPPNRRYQVPATTSSASTSSCAAGTGCRSRRRTDFLARIGTRPWTALRPRAVRWS